MSELIAGDNVVLVLTHIRLTGLESDAPLEQDVSFVFLLRAGMVSRIRSFLTQAEGREVADAAA